MESDRFDALTRSVASRRSFVAKAGGGGLGVALLGALGLREQAVAATSCLLDARLFVRVGPSAGFPLVPKETKTGQLDGLLRLRISSKGDLTGSTFLLSGGSSFPVVGSVSGHQIGLRIALAKDQVLVLQGVDDSAVSSCKGAIDGGLVGPKEGDLGDWHAVVAPANATPTVVATITGSQGGVTTVVPAGPGPTGVSVPPSETPAPTSDSVAELPTATPPFAPPVCSECQELQRGVVTSPGCAPVADDTQCSVGFCCGGVCVDTGENPSHCGRCANVCASGCCHVGVCCPTCGANETLCGMTCVDLSSDPNNCGSCGHVCTSDATCTAGVCKRPVVVCPPGQRNCGGVCVKTPNCP